MSQLRHGDLTLSLHESLFAIFWQGVALFRACNLSRARLTQIARRLKLHEYRAGDVICEEGEPGESMFFVSDGTVSATVGGRHAADIGAHEYFGERALTQKGGVRAATCVAETDCVLFELTRGTGDNIRVHSPFASMLHTCDR